MATAPTPEPTADEPETPRKRRSLPRALVTVGLCGLLAAGGYVLGGRTAGADAEESLTTATVPGDDGTPVEVEFDPSWCEELVEEPALGVVVDLPPMSLNLADQRYLRVAVSLGFREGAHDPTYAPVAPAQDIVVALFSGRTVQELSTPEGRDEVKEELTDRIVEHYGDDVVAVFLTELVMQ